MDAPDNSSQHPNKSPKKHKKKNKEDIKFVGTSTSEESKKKKKKKAKLPNGENVSENLHPPVIEEVKAEKSKKQKKKTEEKKKSIVDPIIETTSIKSPENYLDSKQVSKTGKLPKKRKPKHLDSPVETDLNKNIGLPREVENLEGIPKLKEKKKAKKDSIGGNSDITARAPKTPKKSTSTDNFKQITLHQSLLARGLVSSKKKSTTEGEVKDDETVKAKKNLSAIISSSAAQTPPTVKANKKKKKNKVDRGEKEVSTKKKQHKSDKECKSDKSCKVELSERAKPKKDDKPKTNVKGNKKKKMDIIEKANNNQSYFGQTINISDNSSESTELKIATNEEDTSELSSEYDSSDSEHIMKSIKSFNKKGASKTPVKKGDEPPPPKPKPKIYSSSDDEDSKDDEEEEADDDDEEEDDDDDDVEEIEDDDKDGMEIGDIEEPIAKPDADDVFLDGWTKADVQELLNRMRKEIPKNDFIKAATRLNQMNWENIKFGSHSSKQCYEKWKAIEKKIRGYRILEELLCDAENWLEQPWTDFRKGGKNKNKVQKHPEMPKKPLTTYMIFYMKKKDKIAKEFPGLSLTDLSKVIAERFNKLPPYKKAKYHTMHLAMKEEYTAKMAKFAEAHPTEMARVYGNGSRHKKRTIDMPGWSGGEKPVPPVKLYLNEKMKQHVNDHNYGEHFATYKEKWKELSAKKKLPYIRFAYEQEAKYLEDLKAYHALNPKVDMPKYKPVLSKEERNIIAKTQGKPDKPPSSAYLLFSKTMLKNPSIKGSTPKERMQEVAKLWKNVPESEKEQYKKKVSELHANYKLEYGSYLASLSEDQRKEEEEKGKSKRKGKDNEELAPPPKRSRAASKKLPKLTLEEIMSREPKKPPKDVFELFTHDIKKQFPNKNFPAKEIKKSFDALLDEPRVDLQERLNKLKQTYIIETKKFLKSLSPEDLKLYSASKDGGKSSPIVKPDVKLEESEGSEEDEKERSEGEDERDDDNDEEVEGENNGSTKTRSEMPKAATNAANTKIAAKNVDDSSDESADDDEEDKAKQKSSSSSSSSDSSSDEEGSSSSSSSSSSSGEEDEAEIDAAAF